MMQGQPTTFWPALALATLLALFPALPGAASDLALTGVAWEELDYAGQNWAVDLTAHMQLAALPAAEAASALLPAEQGTPLPAAGPEVLQLTVEMAMDIAFKPKVAISNQVWFNPGDAGPLGRQRVRRGQDEFEKTYRFTQQGVFRRNREPRGAGDAGRPPEDWGYQVTHFYAHDREGLGCRILSDRLLLIYIVAAAPSLHDGRPLSLCVFGKRQLHRVTLEPQGRTPIPVDYVEDRDQTTTPRRETVEALPIKLTAEPLASDLDKPENFSFLGLQRNIVIYLEPRHHLPVRVTGDISTVAAGDLKLRRARLK
jgi:hypothetical protein